MNYAKHVSTVATPQSEPIPGTTQIPNSAGGHAWDADVWQKLDRFLVLGTEGGSYYAGERELTQKNAANLETALKLDGLRTVARIAEISDAGRAPKNDPAIFALAMALKKGDEKTRKAARAAVPKVCRIGTHIFQLAEAVKHLGGWGRSTKGAFADWYLASPSTRCR
jgi:60 kDa SS-A/Ro ribonucleoprotein